jgi:GT2 family glycosyltransferase
VAAQVIAQLGPQDELIIVDDTTGSPGSYEWLGPRGRVLQSHGRGPATARNLGWRAASGDVIAFTDDDVTLREGWLSAIRTEFMADQAVAAAEGRTVTRVFDPVYEYSVCSSEARNGPTCNAAYRRSALVRLGGFDEGFPFPHCEDLDLFTRAQRTGKVVFSPAMAVEHEPRMVVPAVFARRAAWLRSERRLFTRHPQLKPYPLPPGVCALLEYLRWPTRTLFTPSIGSPWGVRRFLRALDVACWWWWHLARAIPSALLSPVYVAADLQRIEPIVVIDEGDGPDPLVASA